MNKFEHWFLKRILKKIVRQGGQDAKIHNLYRMISLATEAEYTEDNIFTRDDFLRGLFEEAQCSNAYRKVETSATPHCCFCGTYDNLHTDPRFGYRCHSPNCTSF